ncbi:hypothetical protein [Mitsuokella sp.]|uniref:hypothetical protein n=1 Tax=Mitsuokella sp. TaxID=2049034 RepID=UPI002A81228A|nr:hypothetical protein [Mitsuokella sp.]MDY4474983.1 hypothetical protein [Mitsuokella sp.]
MGSSILVIVLFALFAIFMDWLGKKGKKLPSAERRPDPSTTLPPPLPRPWPTRQGSPQGETKERLGFKIPEIKGAPPAPGHVDTGGVYRESGAVLEEQRQRQQEEQAARQRHEAYEQAKRLEEARIRAEEQASYLRAAKLPQREASGQQPFLPVLTPESAQQAVVLAELLGSPRAHRPGRWQRHRRHD